MTQADRNFRDGVTTLCWWHHQRGIHHHVLRCRGTAPDGLRFELGLRSDGRRSRSTVRGR